MVSKEEGIMSVLYNRVQKEEVRLFGLIVNYPFIDTLSPRGTFYGPKWGPQSIYIEQKGLENVIYRE